MTDRLTFCGHFSAVVFLALAQKDEVPIHNPVYKSFIALALFFQLWKQNKTCLER